MKRYIIISFIIIFIFFGAGSGVTIYHLLNTTSDLRYLISLHEIKDISQSLSFSFQKIQGYTFSSPAYFAAHLDEIVDNAETVNQIVINCHECHHEQSVEAELDEVGSLIQNYQEQLSYLITTVTEGERRRELQLQVIDQSNVILNKVQDMVNRAANTINSKTAEAMNRINDSYKILAVTLVFTFLAPLLVARYLLRRLVKPVNDLRTAATKIAEGELGYQTEYEGNEEFKKLIGTFNSMSASLAQKEHTIQATLQKLNLLTRITLPLHSALDKHIILNNLCSGIDSLISVEHVGILLPEENDDHLILHLFHTGNDKIEIGTITISRDEVQRYYEESGNQSLFGGDEQAQTWPFAEKLAAIKTDMLLLVWMHTDNTVNGALLAINKKEGDFNEEDSGILAILANNINVALENIRLFKDTQQHMLELKNTQRQLIEAEKLTALGTLAGGVAHDFNNILCGIIGYVALLKRNRQPEDKDFKMLDTIEKAGFRAANLTKQLLTFSRQEVLDLRPIEVNPHIMSVAKLLESTISRLITIKLELGESLPPALSDPAQLEQIIMNLSVNARDAMPKGGQILIRTERVIVDEKFCEEHPEAKQGEYIKVTVTDHGQGIDREVLPRIFDPFFTTKEFGKGTGLGLAMVYGIVKNHRGFITVESVPGRGSTFSVYLPEAEVVRDRESTASDQMLRANVLIVDDEELVASMLAEHLQNLGCKTFLAVNGEEALEAVSKHKNELDIAILDINMPVMDGKEAYERMIEMKSDLKVLLASGYSLNSSIKDILAKGAHGFIQKPYSLEDIIEKIRQVMTEK